MSSENPINRKMEPDFKDLSNELDVRGATAPHQQDFPYERGEEAQVTRREFCNFLALTSSALFAGATGVAAKAALEGGAAHLLTQMNIEGAETLQVGSALNFRYPAGDESAILVRAADGQYFAYGQKC